MKQPHLLSHTLNPESLQDSVQHIIEEIQQAGDKPYITVAQQLDLLEQLQAFDFGRYLIQNQGINGYWTHYMLTHPWFGRKSGNQLTALEDFLLNKAPIMLATQRRFEIFLRENQKHVANNARLACIPCGMMGELLYLDYQNIQSIELIGIDYDNVTLDDAAMLARERGLSKFISLEQKDAWELHITNGFDLISSNGLNIYEPDDKRVSELYKQFYQALKPHGTLVTSFITPPPTLTDNCEWDMSQINQEDLLLQKIIFTDLIHSKWQCFRSSEQTRKQLQAVGFGSIEFIYEPFKMFPTVIAVKD